MKIRDRLRQVTHLFLDTSPLIYYVEENARYLTRVDPVFDQLDTDQLTVVTSAVTLAECLVAPLRDKREDLQKAFTDLIVGGSNVMFLLIDEAIAKQAAELRARYNLSLTDAFQASVALAQQCDGFLTNDVQFKRVKEMSVIVIDELEE